MTPLRWVLGMGGAVLLLWASMSVLGQGTTRATPLEAPVFAGQPPSGQSLPGKEKEHPTAAQAKAHAGANEASTRPSSATGAKVAGASTPEKILAASAHPAAPSPQGAQGEPFTPPPSVDEQPDEEHHDHDAQGSGGWKAPLTWACKGERAYLAGAVTFHEPTPEQLGKALEDASGEGGGLALAIRRSGTDFLVALSASEKSGAGREQFPAGRAPEWVRLVDGFGEPPGVSSERFQPRGYLRVGATWLELTALNWRATEDGGCERVRVDVYALLGSSQWEQPVLRRSGSKAIRDLVEAELLAPPQVSDGVMPRKERRKAPPLPLHFRFQAVSVPFSSADVR